MDLIEALTFSPSVSQAAHSPLLSTCTLVSGPGIKYFLRPCSSATQITIDEAYSRTVTSLQCGEICILQSSPLSRVMLVRVCEQQRILKVSCGGETKETVSIMQTLQSKIPISQVYDSGRLGSSNWFFVLMEYVQEYFHSQSGIPTSKNVLMVIQTLTLALPSKTSSSVV